MNRSSQPATSNQQPVTSNWQLPLSTQRSALSAVCPSQPATSNRAAFTLVEVLISLAIALILIIGISQIFAIAQRTTGAGTALLGMNAAGRSIQTVLNQDFHDIITDSSDTAGIVIASHAITAFFDKPDLDNDRDQLAQTFNDPGSSGPGSNTSPYSQPFSPNSRIHRLDRLGFFARNVYHRQTADAPNFMSPTTSSDAFIWYGHLALLNNAGIASWDPANPGLPGSGTGAAWLNPGVNTPPSAQPGAINDNNRFASQWILGREAILLLANGADQGYPLGSGSYPLSILPNVTTLDGTSKAPQLFSSRYDLSYTTMVNCYNAYRVPPIGGATAWWENLTGLDLGTPVPVGTSLINRAIANDQRYYGNPYPTKPNTPPYTTDSGYRGQWHTSASAQTSPIFVRGCTQFIVEFAGDYVQQDRDPTDTNPTFGKVTGLVPDGAIDFIPVKDSAGHWTRQIRWYGYPRDVNGNDPKTNAIILGQPDGILDPNDVMPLNVFMNYETGLNGLGAVPIIPFERATPDKTAIQINNTPSIITFNPEVPGQPQSTSPYVCAWGPDSTPWTSGPGLCNALPKMIRITIATGDPNGRLNTDRSFEYVFTLP